MRICTFHSPGGSSARLGVVRGEEVVDVATAAAWALDSTLPASVEALIAGGDEALDTLRRLLDLAGGSGPSNILLGLEEVILHAPLARPNSLRDFYAFEQHVATANANRGRTTPAEWYEAPAFYFSNHTAIVPPGATVPYPRGSDALDYELEVACIIGRAGRDIGPERAEEHIFGYTIFNDWSARDRQRREMRVGLGPAKAKDFASTLGPWIVTPDELVHAHTGRPGVYDLAMVARVNGAERSRGNWKDLHFSFGEMIAHASTDVWLRPGDVLGSGTVGTGCLLEITRGEGPWLQVGDRVELEVEGLGVLANRIGPPPAQG